MRDPKRIHEVMTRLEELWNLYPDWRFMQLISNMQSLYGNDMFYVEEPELLRVIDIIKEGNCW